MSNVPYASFTVAVAQAASVFLDRVASLEKACELIVDAGNTGARLIVFPAAFIPGYPAWVWAIPPAEAKLLNEMYAELLAKAVIIPSDTTDRLCRIAQRARINVVIGLNERSTEGSGATCYNTLLYIDAQGQILGKHRSLVLSGAERLIWTPGDASTLQVHQLPFGKISGLIGGEHYLPLARYALYAWGTQIYVAASWASSEPWLSTLRHIAKEGSVFVIGCGVILHKDDIPDGYQFKQFYTPDTGAWIAPGDSVIASPDGEFIAGPLREREGILYAKFDPRQVSGAKWMFDVAGQEARPDIFQLTVHRAPQPLIQAQELQI